MTIQTDPVHTVDPVHTSDPVHTVDELWLSWHGAAQAVRAALASASASTGGRPRVPRPRVPSSQDPGPDLAVALARMHDHQQSLVRQVSSLEDAGVALPGCRTALADMLLTLARLRRFS